MTALRREAHRQAGSRLLLAGWDVMREASDDQAAQAFLATVDIGDHYSGTVAEVTRDGAVAVALDEFPGRPLGVIGALDLSWVRFAAAVRDAEAGQRVSCEFLVFDTSNGEARLSLKAMRPDPFQVFSASAREGRVLPGRVTELVPFGAFVEVADGVEGLVRLRELTEVSEEAVRVGEEIAVTVVHVDRERRRLLLSRCRAPADSR